MIWKGKIGIQASLHIVQDQFVDSHSKNIPAAIRKLGTSGEHV